MTTKNETAKSLLNNLTPGEIGIIAATLDDLRKHGDDEAYDILTETIFFEISEDMPTSEVLAYHIIHTAKRRLETETTFWGQTWNLAGTDRMTVSIPKS